MAHHCSCDERMKKGGRGGFQLHLRSIAHRKPELVRLMVADPSRSLRELGRRLKLSGERVRQLALELGIDRRRERENWKQQQLLQQQKTNLPRWATPTLSEKLGSLRRGGYEVLVCLTSAGEVSASDLEINEHRCTIRIARRAARSLTGQGRVKYYSFRLRSRSAEFVLFHIEGRDETYVVPVKWLAPGVTSYVPYGRIDGYHNSQQRDWEQWKEAWSQLKTAR